MTYWLVAQQLVKESSDSGDFTWGKLLVGVAVVVLGNAFLDWIRTCAKRRRLKSSLLVECLETLNKLSDEQFKYCRTKGDDENDWKCIQDQVRGFIFGTPLDEPKELVSLTNEREARLVVRFYERWSLFVSYEQYHAKLHDQLVEIISRCCGNAQEADDVRRMKEECWSQLEGALATLKDAARDLCGLSCALFRQFAWPSECKLRRLSENRWQSWQAFEEEASKYPCFSSASTKCC